MFLHVTVNKTSVPSNSTFWKGVSCEGCCVTDPEMNFHTHCPKHSLRKYLQTPLRLKGGGSLGHRESSYQWLTDCPEPVSMYTPESKKEVIPVFMPASFLHSHSFIRFCLAFLISILNYMIIATFLTMKGDMRQGKERKGSGWEWTIVQVWNTSEEEKIRGCHMIEEAFGRQVF